MHFLSEYFAQGSAEDSEVLTRYKYFSTVYRSPAGDDSVCVGAFVQSNIVCSVASQHIELVERAIIEQVLNALASEHFSFFVLPRNSPFGAGVQSRLSALFEII